METMNWRERIELPRPGDEPKLKGSAVGVEAVLARLAAGDSEASLQARFPGLTGDDVRACIAYAAEAVYRARFVESVQRGMADTLGGRVIDDEDLWESIDPDHTE